MLSSATLDRLLCDASCVPVLEVDGKPVLAGNKTPTIPRNMRRALRARDQGCRFPGCTNTRRVDAHHVVWKSKGGPTEPWNLVLLCRFHHTSIHHRGFVAQWRDGDFRFFRPDGTEIPPVPDQGRSQGPGILERHRQMDLEITPDTLPPDWGGSVLDSWGLSQAVECLLQRHGSLN